MRHRVLVADDQEDLRDLFTSFLELRGYDVRSVADGVQAVREARAWRPHVVLMDLAMPNMDGREATQILKCDAATRQIKVFMITGNVRADAAHDACPECDDVLIKPVDLPSLAAQIAEAIGALSD
ncbi:MAG: response regulator [Myxococcota bacterium]|nr:response regulator [Myxococcota bacterium]